MKNFVIVTVLMVFLLFVVVGCAEDEVVPEETIEPEETIDTPSYEVISISDVSFGNAKRFVWDVVISEPVTTEQLEIISQNIVEEAKNKEPFNALSVMYYDYEEYIGYGYTLGGAEFAPEGDWSKADTVRTGDYDNMSFKWSLRNKDWSKQLTPEEVKVWALWMEISDTFAEDGLYPDDEEINEIVANELNMTHEDVDSIIWKQLTWTFLNE